MQLSTLAYHGSNEWKLFHMITVLSTIMACLFPELTHAEFARREVECTTVFGSRRNPVIFDFTMGKVCSRLAAKLTTKRAKWRFKCPVAVAYLPVLALWPWIKS